MASLQRGSRGDDVAVVQQVLNDLGAHIAVDGQFGPETDTAVREFQSTHGLTVDGIVGRDTIAAMRQALSERRATAAAASQSMLDEQPEQQDGGGNFVGGLALVAGVLGLGWLLS